MAQRPRRTSSRGESTYRPRRHGRAVFYTRRILYDDLAVVIRRFPTVAGGPTGGRPYVLVHGIGVSSRYFHPTAAELAKRGPVFLVDLPGYGSAPNPHRDVTIRDHAEVLYRFLAAAGIDRPILVGHSMGTQVVTRLVFDHPEVTDRIALIAPTMDPKARRFVVAAGRLLRDSIFFEPFPVKAQNIVDFLFRSGLPYVLKQVPHLLDDHIEDRLPALAVRALVMRGEKDRISPERWSRRVAGLMQDATYVTVPGPHVVMFTDPPRVAELIAGLAS
jgi:pimeloyl-ACP methyl ester carboxylesterase